MLESRQAPERIAAIVAIAQAGEPSAIPALVERLEDEDPAVRFYAILALERLTGERRGFDYADPIAERRAAVLRWRAFVQESGAQTAR